FYEVDVASLEVTELYPDGNAAGDVAGPLLPGYHGKGLFSGQGVLVYANNGERSPKAQRRPDIASGCLASWDGADWTVVRRNQFTEVTGPGGVHGNDHPDSDPLWSVGWDHRSLILMMLDQGEWHCYRLPKASHCYDGAHGWNTEWPRIRDIGEDDLLMTMHGMFWRFPRTFAAGDTAGIGPRSTYLKVIGDFCRWGDRIVFGCDDTARNEFLNKRKAKGKLAGPGQSQSNLWFVPPERIDRLGPPLGRGAVWLNDAVAPNTPSDAFLFAGYDLRAAHIACDGPHPTTFTFEVDDGTSNWRTLRSVEVRDGYDWVEFQRDDTGQWIRVSVDRACNEATVFFTYASDDTRGTTPASMFEGVASLKHDSWSGGLIRARGDNLRNLHFAATQIVDGKVQAEGYYELDVDMQLRHVDDPRAHKWLKRHVAVPKGVLEADAASVLYVDDEGQRFRLPKGDPAFDEPSLIPLRVDREVCTERDLFNCHGTFYELPAENAGGFAKIRPIATHNRRITDYCSWRGLLVMTGIAEEAVDNPHIIRSGDGACAVWVGAVDDLWSFGKPVGHGGPLHATVVKAGKPSDPYLMTGFDKKTLALHHDSQETVEFTVEVDIAGTGLWQPYKRFTVPAGERVSYTFPDAFQAYWVRVTANRKCRATAWFEYE
ncbi:MAG: hypothetical protein GY851_27580, partial [bacterium]|nr:hypothetical protein [bacterium]